MGNKFIRRRETPADGGETTASEQKATENPVATQQAEDSVISQNQEAVKPEIPAAAVAAAASEPVEESVPATKTEPEPEVPVASTPLEVEPAPVAKEDPVPAQPEPEPEPLVSASEPPAPKPEPEPVPKPELVTEPAPEPVVEAVPEPEPVVEAIPEPIPEPAPAESMEQEAAQLTQESLPEPVISSVPLVDVGVPDLTQPINTPPSPADVPDPANPENGIEAAVNSMPVQEKSTESGESLKKPVEPESEVVGNVEQLVCDVNEVIDSGLLKHLDLTGNDLINDQTPTDVKIPDDIPVEDISASTELM